MKKIKFAFRQIVLLVGVLLFGPMDCTGVRLASLGYDFASNTHPVQEYGSYKVACVEEPSTIGPLSPEAWA